MKKSKSILKILMASMLVLMLVMLTGCGDSDKEKKESSAKEYSEVLENYFKGVEEKDPDKYLKAFADVYADYYYSDSIDEDYMEDMMESIEEECGDNVKISYEVKKEEKIDDDGLKTIQKYAKEMYNEDVKIEAGYELKVKVTIKGDDDENSTTTTLYVYKVDGKWGLINESPDQAKSYLDLYGSDSDSDEDEDDEEDVKTNSKNKEDNDEEEDDDTSKSTTKTSSISTEYKDALDKYFKGMEKADMKTYLGAFPSFYKDLVSGYLSDDMMKQLTETFTENYGDNFKIDYKVTNETKMTSTELSNIQKYIEKTYSQNVTVSDGYEVEIEATITGNSDSETDTDTMYVYKIDGKWSVLTESPADAESYAD